MPLPVPDSQPQSKSKSKSESTPARGLIPSIRDLLAGIFPGIILPVSTEDRRPPVRKDHLRDATKMRLRAVSDGAVRRGGLVIIARKFALYVVATAVVIAGAYSASLLEWNTVANLGTETTEPTTFTATNVVGSDLTLGAGVSPAANGNRFGGNNWADAGDAVPPTLANSIAGNDYIQFTITPNAGFSFTATGFNFIWDHSTTGPTLLTLRSSADGFASDLASGSSIPAMSTTAPAFTNLSFTLANITVATTFRLYAYGTGTGTAGPGGTAGFDTIATLGAPNVLLLGSTTTIGPVSNTYWDTNSTTAGSGNAGGLWSAANWNSTADGTTTTPGTFADGGMPTFSAGTDGTGTFTVQVDIPVHANGMSFEEGNVTIAHAAGGSLTLVGTSIVVANGATATILEAIGGTVGLSKDGAGTLTLSGTNTYTGGTNVDNGILIISSDANLGDANGALTMVGGALQTAVDVSVGAGRALSGNGTFVPAAGTTLTFNGAVSLTSVILGSTGTVATAGSGVATKSITSVAFTAAATLANTHDALALGSITTTQATGTATISGPLSLGAGTHAVSVADGSAAIDLAITGAISGSGGLSKSGTGTMALTGDNIGYSGTVTVGGTTLSGGVISINSSTALGIGTFNFDTGTLSNDSGTPLTGLNQMNNSNISIGANATGAGATLAGSPMEFAAAVGFFGNNAQKLNVNNTTTLSGVITTNGGTTNTTSTGLTVAGTGMLILTADNSTTFTEPLTVSGSLQLVVNGSLAGSSLISVGGTSTLGGSGAVGALTVAIGGTISPGDTSAATNALGKLSAGNTILQSGGRYKLELQTDGTGAGGTNWDQLAVTGTLDLSGLSPGAPFTLQLQTLTGAGAGGLLASFNPGSDHDWLDIITTTGGITGTFASADFVVDTTGFANAFGGAFTVVLDGNNLDLHYSFVPEPTATLSLLTGTAMLIGFRRRRVG